MKVTRYNFDHHQGPLNKFRELPTVEAGFLNV
jgi:hypothetical protein